MVIVPVLAAEQACALPTVTRPQATAPQPAAASSAAAQSAWQADEQRRQAELLAQNGPGTNADLRAQLLKMRDTDQNARGMTHGENTHEGKLQMPANLRDIDAALTTQLKDIYARNGWPTISMVGLEGSNAAMLILTHTQDHAWQVSLLPRLESLADAGRIDGSTLAVVIDKELVSEGKLQRYGTQFKVVDGELAMIGVEDPAGLDARRAKIFLPPMSVYKQMLAQMYHLKAGNKIVMATAPSAEPQ